MALVLLDLYTNLVIILDVLTGNEQVINIFIN